MPKQVLILDSSQIDTFLECQTLWYYKYYRSLIPNEQRNNVPMDMGTYGHKLLEIIYKERASGRGLNAIDTAFNYNIDKETCRCSHGAEKHKTLIADYNYKGYEIMQSVSGCEVIGCPCENFQPIEFPLSVIDREFVRTRVLEYTMAEGSAIPELVPQSPTHVEVGFSEKIYEDDKRLFVLEGRIDLLGQIAGNVPNGWADHKFQARERNLYLKSIQFRNYSMVTKLPIGVVNYIRFAKKVEKDKTFKRSIISFSRAEMEAWRRNLVLIFRKIEQALWINNWYNDLDEHRNRAACSGKFGYPCDYTKLCEEFNNPQLIQIYEQSEYQKKNPWRPW